jgi:nucleoside-diphosphate-sugar epimerase
MNDLKINTNNNPVVGITGATGLIGSELCDSLEQNDYRVIRLIRNPARHVDRKYLLEEEPVPDLFTDIDILIHCAYDKNDREIETGINYLASKRLFEVAALSGVSHIIFISSIAAQPAILSSYGQSKLAIEKLLNLEEHTILKPALIIGNGGLFKRLLKTALSKKFIPLVGNGQQSLQYLAIADLQKAVLQVIEEKIAGKFVLANKENTTYKDFFIRLSAHYNKKIKFVKIGSSLLLAGIRIGNLVGIRLPINRENILGLVSQQYETPANIPFDLTTTLEQALKALDQK